MTESSKHIRIEILVDAPLLRPITDLIREAGASGYTVLPTAEGWGSSGGWSDDQISSAQHKLMVLTIADPVTSERLLEALRPLLDSHGLVVTAGEVTVMRPQKYS